MDLRSLYIYTIWIWRKFFKIVWKIFCHLFGNSVYFGALYAKFSESQNLMGGFATQDILSSTALDPLWTLGSSQATWLPNAPPNIKILHLHMHGYLRYITCFETRMLEQCTIHSHISKIWIIYLFCKIASRH